MFFAISPNASESMAHRRINSAAITMGKYSEREGDRDMLENARGSPMMAKADDQFGTGQLRQTINGRWTIGQMVEKQRQLHQQMISQQQQQTLSRPVRPIVTVQSFPTAGPARGALPNFVTNLSRFASAPAAANNRIVLPPIFVERIRTDGYANPWVEKRTKQKKTDERTEEKPKEGNYGANGIERPKTLILTNERIAKLPDLPNGQKSNNLTLKENEPIPLSEFRHEDIRPAVDGERMGPQAKYAGQTNEYKEDWGKQFTKTNGRRYYGPLKVIDRENEQTNGREDTDINPPPEGTRIKMDGRNDGKANEREGQWHRRDGTISPYVNAPEEITGSRFRNIDEQFNAMNGGNGGRSQNRYVKMDLLNE
ncbi:hypothetical protein niasHS_012053 [Heterodera schachtii]|uniref:Uncharacterized protein n=1 Tax=Heterodera schachtii TaxID=97005 RepID=A0ABD2IGB6_HETSC